MNKTYYPIINGDNRKYKVQLIKSSVIITEIETNKKIKLTDLYFIIY